MKQTIEIEVPEGKKAVWKDGKVFFTDETPKLPKTWEEFCENYPIKKGESFINNASTLEPSNCGCRLPYSDANILPSFEASKAHLTLMKLHQLRDCYRQGWEPDWHNIETDKYCIVSINENLKIIGYATYKRFLSFQSKNVAEEFLNNFRDLIEQAGDLI